MQLSGDYRKAERKVSIQYEGLKPPFTREAPALFEADGKKYMITSGMTGYIPNRSECAVSEDWEKPFSGVGNPHIFDHSDASFNSQINKIFPVEGAEDIYRHGGSVGAGVSSGCQIVLYIYESCRKPLLSGRVSGDSGGAKDF